MYSILSYLISNIVSTSTPFEKKWNEKIVSTNYFYKSSCFLIKAASIYSQEYFSSYFYGNANSSSNLFLKMKTIIFFAVGKCLNLSNSLF